jgi:hypothetical protein
MFVSFFDARRRRSRERWPQTVSHIITGVAAVGVGLRRGHTPYPQPRAALVAVSAHLEQLAQSLAADGLTVAGLDQIVHSLAVDGSRWRVVVALRVAI